tara:strand:- start:18724 stop:19368 length:645 start_codon:yes stop_codon:yes gene_type:complete
MFWGYSKAKRQGTTRLSRWRYHSSKNKRIIDTALCSADIGGEEGITLEKLSKLTELRIKDIGERRFKDIMDSIVRYRDLTYRLTDGPIPDNEWKSYTLELMSTNEPDKIDSSEYIKFPKKSIPPTHEEIAFEKIFRKNVKDIETTHKELYQGKLVPQFLGTTWNRFVEEIHKEEENFIDIVEELLSSHITINCLSKYRSWRSYSPTDLKQVKIE